MARIPEQFTGDLCPHGIPKEFGSQCAECEAKEKPLVDISGVRPKINLSDAEIDELISRIDKGEITGELIQFKVSENSQERPVAVSREEIEAPAVKEESNMDRLKREAGETAQRIIELESMSRKDYGKEVSNKIFTDKKIIDVQNIVKEYLEIFKSPKARKIGREALSSALADFTSEFSPTRKGDIDMTVNVLGLNTEKYRLEAR